MDKCGKEDMFLSLKLYKKMAERCLYKFGKKLPKQAYSEDNISYVMYSIMKGDVRYKEGIGSRSGYRVANAKYAVRSLLHKYHVDFFKKRKKKKMLKYISLDVFVAKIKRSRHDIISDNKLGPVELFETKEIVSFIEKSDCFSKTEKWCLLKHFIENMSQKDIAEELSLTRQTVSASILSGVKKLRKRFNESET